MKCPDCGYSMADTDLSCPRCEKYSGEVHRQNAQEQMAQVKADEHASGSSGGRMFGFFLILAGICAAGYFMFVFDPTVKTETITILGQTIGGTRVNNIGLLADRQNGILCGIGGAILGSILMYTCRMK